MSNYYLVSALHAAGVTLADARKADDAAAVAAAEAQVAATRDAVDAALADGRVAFATHLLDLDLDCLGTILSRLGPRDTLSVACTCSTLRSALFRGGLPVPLAGVCSYSWPRRKAAQVEAAVRALDEMEPALGATRLAFRFATFDEGQARMLARALDKAPRATRISIELSHFRCFYDEDRIKPLADILSSPDRAFAGIPRVHVMEFNSISTDALRRLVSTGACVVSIWESDYNRSDDLRWLQIAANTLTSLKFHIDIPLNLTARFPALRRLVLASDRPQSFSIDMPSLTALAPLLKEIYFMMFSSYSSEVDDLVEPTKHGFGFEPRRFAQFVAAIQGVTRVQFYNTLGATLSHNENENLGQLAALSTLRDLEIECALHFDDPIRVALGPRSSYPGPLRAPVAADVITNLPPLAPGLTRLKCSDEMRVAFSHPLPELRALDLRESAPHVACETFWTDTWDRSNDDDDEAHDRVFEECLRVPLAIPSAAIAPNLHTLLIGYDSFMLCHGYLDLWMLVAARTALRVVVIEWARLRCNVPDGFKTTTAGFAALLAREAKDLVSVHMHNCVIKRAHKRAVKKFLRAVEERGGRVCRDEECLFCMLHDGKDLWPRRW